jgi:dipeptidyl aminopeptidase/acylaminoacyl peptidase
MPNLRRPLATLALTLLSALAAAQGDVLSPHDVALLRSVGAAEISPDGATIAYTLSVPRTPGEGEDGAAWSELHVIARDGSAPRPFVTGEVNVGSVSWTPDGSGIAFTAKRDGDKGSALYILPIDGGEARRAASLPTSVRGYAFSPDGRRVALLGTAEEQGEVKARKDKGFKQEIYEESAEFTRVWLAEVDGLEPARELGVEGHVYAVEWSPLGDALLVSRAPTPLVDDQYMRQRAALVSAEDGSLRVEFATQGKLGAVGFSPDGARVALIAAADLNDPNPGRLWIGDARTGALFEALPNFAADVDAFAWQDADTLMYVASHGCETALEEVDVGAGRGENRHAIVAPGALVMTGLSLSDDGQSGAFAGSTPAHASELFAMAHGQSGPQRLTDSNPRLAEVRLAEQEVLRFQARDGLELEGVLIRPLDAVEGRRYPLILYVHGGPEAHEQNGWQTSYSKPGQVAAARGFAVFHPNYRGSTGRGVEFSKLSQGDPAGKEFEDLVDAVDHLIAIGLVDEAKVGVTGGSYGGYATAWCATRFSERFAAGVMMVGIGDKVSKVGTTDIPNEEFHVHALKRVWDDWQFFLERSPIYHAGDARTPLLILHGKDDPRVDPGQSREMYRHLKLRGKAPARLVLYPGEGHGNRKACARLDYNLRLLQWMEHYLQGPGGEMPPYEVDYAQPQPAAGP